MNDKIPLEDLSFAKTAAHPCSYLKGEMATTLFMLPNQSIDNTVYTALAEFGFRRSGRHIYKPFCGDCQACISVRVPTNEFEPTRNQKRVIKKNHDIEQRWVKSIDTEEHYQLFEKYIRCRHQDGDMYPASKAQFQDFLVRGVDCTQYIEFRFENKLMACSVVDVIENGLSAVYTYFDPDYDHRSPGKLAILSLIEQAKHRKLPYLYLGYWIKECAKMNYKSDYRPMEILRQHQWLRVN